MEKRYFLALLLAAAVVAITQILFPVSRPASTPSRSKTAIAVADSGVRPDLANPPIISPQATQPVITSPAGDSSSNIPLVVNKTPEVVTISTPRSSYKFTNVGAAPLSIVLSSY